MKTSRWLALGLAALLLQAWGGNEFAFKGGKCLQDDAGSCVVEVGGQKLKFEVCWIDPRWGTPVIAGALKASVTNEMLRLAFSARPGCDQALNKDHPMMLRVRGDASSHRTGRMQFGQMAKTFEKSCWSWGDRIGLQPHKAEFRLSRPLSMNYLIDNDGAWQMRLFFGGATAEDGERVFEGALTLAQADVKVVIASDVIDQKREQYRRILVPPQERGLDRSKWLELCAAPSTGQTELSRLEDLMDARSRLYSFAQRMSDEASKALVGRGYRALAAMDVEGTRAAIAALGEREKANPPAVPLTAFNPFSWIKCFTQWGYVRHPDGCSVYEPMPWNMVWQDGFKCAVAQDPRVAIANTKGHPFHYETRFLEPMTDVSFTRDWVSTKWHMPDGSTVTFSLLTPIVAIDDVETVRLSGFPTAPERVSYIGPCAEPWHVQLSDAPQIEAEVIPSVLMDFSQRPEIPAARSWGVQKIRPETVARPWLRLYSTAGNWSLMLICSERPVAVCWEKGVLSLKLEKKGSVGVLRPPLNLHDGEHPALAEFFTRVFACCPDACEERVKDGYAQWRYTYRERRMFSGDAGFRIAPVPPFTAYAGARFERVKTSKYTTKWGLFRYVEGDRCTCDQPTCPVDAVPHAGLNASVWEKTDELAQYFDKGLRFVRLFSGGKHTLDETCAQYDAMLSVCEKRGVKALIDPHNRLEFKVQWKGGIPPDEDALFVAEWEALAKVGARHPNAVAGYDLYNEPGLVAGSEERWRSLCGKAADAILRVHPTATIYYPGGYGGNQNGLFNLRPLDLDKGRQTITYHVYSPHSFTHQKVQTHNVNDTYVFYPSWAPAMNWSKNHFGGTTVDWFDKWTLGALMLPAFEHYAEHRVPLNCGEFAVIGYANGKAPNGAFEWTRDTVELLTHGGHSWNLWNLGFGLGNTLVRDYVYGIWEKGNGR